MSVPRVCLDCESLKEPHSGFSHFIVPLAHELLAQNEPRRFKFYFFAPPAAVGVLGTRGVHYLTQKSYHQYLNPYSYRMQVWHATEQLSRYVPTNPLVKVVLTVHDLNFLHDSPSEHSYARQLALVRHNIGRADYLVTTSDFVLQDVLHHADLLGYTGSQPLRYIRRGVQALPTPADGHRPALVPAHPFLFGLGSIGPRKNWHVLLPLLDGNDYELVIAGSSAEHDYSEQLLRDARRAGLGQRVHLLTRISEADKAWYFAHCLAYLQPSLAEGFSSPVAEAMQQGRPVFLSRRTSLPELGGDAAYYFDDFAPAHLRQRLAEGLAAHTPARAAATVAQAAQFGWAEAAREYLNVYAEVLK